MFGVFTLPSDDGTISEGSFPLSAAAAAGVISGVTSANADPDGIAMGEAGAGAGWGQDTGSRGIGPGGGAIV